MDIARIGVLIWLLLPIPVYLFSRRRHNFLIRKYPSTTSGIVVDASFTPGFGEYDSGSTNLTYKYTVAGTEYTGQGFVTGNFPKPGGEIPIRYHPEQPQKSILWQPTTTTGWLMVGLLWLGLNLGYAVFVISIGILFIYAATIIVLRRTPKSKLMSYGKVLTYTLICIFIGFPCVVGGLFFLIASGFLDQNILWALWNHRSSDG